MLQDITKEVKDMKIKYSPDSDILIVELKEDIPEDSIDLSEGIIVHFNRNKEPIEIELLDASKITEIGEISLSIPAAKTVLEPLV